MGVRLIEDFLARANTGRCNDFRETADIIAKVGANLFTLAVESMARASPSNTPPPPAKKFSL